MISEKAQSNPADQPLQLQQPHPLTAEVNQLRMEKAALSQMLWELVRQSNPETHTAEVSSEVTDPLWQLVFVAGSKEGTTKILACTIRPISEQEKKRVVRRLRATNKPMAEALLELELPFPTGYVEQQIAAHLVWKTSVWESVRAAGIGERLKNAINVPKS